MFVRVGGYVQNGNYFHGVDGVFLGGNGDSDYCCFRDESLKLINFEFI